MFCDGHINFYYMVFFMKSVSLLNISFSYPRGDMLFDDLSFSFNDYDTVAIIGDNGAGKTTLLNIIVGAVTPDSGRVIRNATTYLLPQITRCDSVSGGQHQMSQIIHAFNSGADILLLDEPTNNLDRNARNQLFNLIRDFPGGIIIVSHDRELLNQMDCLLELRGGKIRTFGGNYDFYVRQTRAMRENMESQYTDTVKEIRRLNHSASVATNTAQTHIKKQARDRVNMANGSRIEANALKGKSTETAARRLQIINKKLQTQITQQRELSNALRNDVIKIPTPSRPMHKNDLIDIRNMSFGYDAYQLLFQDFNLHMRGGARIHLRGNNGAGKTTLVKLVMGKLAPSGGTVKLNGRAIYLDQNLSLLNQNHSIVDNIIDFGAPDINTAHAIAANFGFRGDASHRRVGTLSGGERLKATLAAILGGKNQPDLIILDEPTNNLDIASIEILESALNQYQGALIIISHDEMFVRNLRDMESVDLN